MEMILILVSLCLPTFLAFFFLKQILKRKTTKLNLPPSPWRLPVIGNLHQLSLHPHRSLGSLSHRYGPLMLLHFGRVPVLVISSAETAHEVMKTHELKFSDRPKSKAVDKLLNGGTDVAFSPYGDHWRHMKSICVLNLLSNKTVRSYEHIRKEEINVMMEKLEKASSSSSSVDLSELLTTLSNDVVTRIVLGRKYSSEEGGTNSNNIVRRVAEVLGAFPLGQYIPSLAWLDWIRGVDRKIEKASTEIGGFLEKVVQEHVDAGEKTSSDFVDILLSIQSDKTRPFKLDINGLKILLVDMLFGASGMTFTLIEWTMTELMRHPECMKKLKDEIRSISTDNSYITEKEVGKMNYLNVVIKEVLRLHPSGPLVPRLLKEDVKLNGYDIARGTHVIINLWAIQRETTSWGADAEEFRPERHLESPMNFLGQNFKYIPFGSGRRGCPGIGFALALVEVTVANLVNRFDWSVNVGGEPHGDGDDKPDVFEAIGIDVCRKYPLVASPSSLVF